MDAKTERKKPWRERNFHKWIVEDDDGVTIRGLSHPETEKEAEAEKVRLGISGVVKARSRFEKSPKYKRIMLMDQRVEKKRLIEQHTRELLDSDLETVRHIVALGMQMDPKAKEIFDLVEAKIAWIDKAKKEELDAYFPQDDNWPALD